MLNTNMGRSVLCDQQKILFCFKLILLLFFQGLPLNRMNITSGQEISIHYCQKTMPRLVFEPVSSGAVAVTRILCIGSQENDISYSSHQRFGRRENPMDSTEQRVQRAARQIGWGRCIGYGVSVLLWSVQSVIPS